VKRIRSFFLSTFITCFTLLFFTGCEDKKVQEPLIPVENTTEVFTQKDKEQQYAKQEKSETKEKSETEEILETKQEGSNEETAAAQTSANIFILTDIQQNRYRLSINDQKITFHDINQSIAVVNFFTTWYSPCRGEIPYLSDLQEKYKKKVFVMGILVNDIQDDNTLKQFMDKYHAKYFISNSTQNDTFAAEVVKTLQLPENFPIPLTVIYKDGNYYTHYEGAVPIEMIEYDIQEAIKHKGL
jgi:thiol-disulfide isomerase/thioredoxin